MQSETVIQRKYMNKINIIYMLSFKSILLIFKDCLHYIFIIFSLSFQLLHDPLPPLYEVIIFWGRDQSDNLLEYD